MGSFHIDIRCADGSRHRRRQLTGNLSEACVAALDMAREEADSSSIPGAAWIDLYEGDLLHISISIIPGAPLVPGAQQPPRA